ncbi:MAG: CvpA family protein [Candidatus Omnitrophica bacterium]|nr:CvpA family protein [Candidatus Omnitrophota bacterium]
MKVALSNLNWVDIFCLILLIRILYVAVKQGIVIEIFKLLGSFSSVFFASHYYSALSTAIPSGIKCPRVVADMLSFIALIIAGYLLIFLLRIAFFRFFKIEAAQTIDKWAALLIGAIRGTLVISITLLFFLLTSAQYLSASIKSSFLAVKAVNIAPRAYAGMWENIMSKFIINDEINSGIFEVAQRGSE